MKIRIRMCDNCGKINPKRLYGRDRMCAECAEPKGFYQRKGDALGAWGKVGWYKIRFPLIIRWCGWLTLGGR